MKVELHWPDKVTATQFSKDFLQKMLNPLRLPATRRKRNRLAVAYFRYGRNDRSAGETKKWIFRAYAEIDAYVNNGNSEHLVNAANYLMCERINPEHKGHHFKVVNNRSVTRGKC